MTQTKNPHVLETESIGKLLIQYSIPAIIAMTVTSVYNIVDSILSDMEWDLWLFRDWP